MVQTWRQAPFQIELKEHNECYILRYMPLPQATIHLNLRMLKLQNILDMVNHSQMYQMSQVGSWQALTGVPMRYLEEISYAHSVHICFPFIT
jgi:hypothetical protein